jgi:hypothetical protein
MSFKMDCPHCKRTLNVTEKAFGKTVPCPGCKQPVTLPRTIPPPPVHQVATTVSPLPVARPKRVVTPQPTRSAAPPIPPELPPVPRPDAGLDFLNDLREGVTATSSTKPNAQVVAVRGSKTRFTTLTQIGGAVACVIGIIVGAFAYGHRPGNIEQAFAGAGPVLQPAPYYVAILISAFILVAGAVASLKPGSLGGRILLALAAPIALALLLFLALIVRDLQAMRDLADRRQQELGQEGASATDPSDGVTAQARNAIEAKLLHVDESWYGYEMNSFSGSPQRLVEMKKPSIKAKAFDLNPADKANGIQWRGTVRIECEVYRTVPLSIHLQTKAMRVVARWGEWQTGVPVDTPLGKMGGGVPVFAVDPFKAASPELDLTIRNGRWEWCVERAQQPDRAIIP